MIVDGVIGLIEFAPVVAFGGRVISGWSVGFLGHAVAGAHKIIDVKLI